MQAVVLALCSAFFFASGHAVQKLAVSRGHARDRERGTGGPARVFRLAWMGQPLWLAGLLSILFASALDLQAVSAGDLTLVKPLLGLQAAFAVAIGVGLLGEPMGRGEGTALALLVAGAVLVILTSTPGESRPLPPASSAGIFGLTFATAVALVLFHLRFPGRLGAEAAFGLAVGILYGVSDFMMKRATSLVAASEGGFSVVDPKSLWALLGTPEVIWIVVANTAAFTAMQLAYSRGRIAVLNPLSSLSGTGFAVTLGFLVLGEPLSLARGAGIALVLGATLGVVRSVPAGGTGEG